MKLKQRLIGAILILSINSGIVKAQIAKIPFQFHGTHLSIKVQTNQSDSLNFVFDTGATGASIDSATAERAGITKENREVVSMAGSGGSQSYMMATHQSLKLNNVELKDINMVLVDFTALSKEVGSRLDGIIGYEVLNRYVTNIDFDHKILSLYDQIKSIDTTGYTGIPFEFSRNILIPRFPITVTLANGETFTGKVMFDTGNSFSLIVSTPFSKFHDFNSKLGETGLTMGRGMNASTRDQLANIRSMSFAGFNFGQMGIRLTVNEKAEAKDGYLGILGIEIIKRFNVILDYANKKIYLKPNRAYHDALKLETVFASLAKESKAFLEKNKAQPGIKVTASGLQYKILKEGSGAKPSLDDRVAMNFSITTINGKKLWSMGDDGKPWVHRLNKIMPGMREAALMMNEGAKWILYIPAALGYGELGYEDVPPGTALVCEIEILKSKSNN